MFAKSICDRFDPKSDFLGPLTKLRQTGTQPRKDFIFIGMIQIVNVTIAVCK